MDAQGNQDRLTALPDPVLRHIFSFMPMHEVVRSSLLSKRWTQLWKSVCILNICDPFEGYDVFEDCDSCYGEGLDLSDSDYDVFWAEEHLSLRTKKFEEFVDGIMLCRDHGFNIHKFSLEGFRDELAERYPEDTGQVGDWISSALKQNVQDIHLCCIQRVQLQTIDLASQVKILKLDCLSELERSTTRGELHLSSQVLENLTIRECEFDALRRLCITTPLLKVLELCNLSTEKKSFDINLHAPILESLHITADSYFRRCLPNLVTADLPNLVRADIRIELDQHVANKLFKCLNGLLNGVVYAQSLSIELYNYAHFMNVGPSPTILQCIPNLFQNLRCLKLVKWYGNSYIKPIEKLLEYFPNIETLILEEPKENFPRIKTLIFEEPMENFPSIETLILEEPKNIFISEGAHLQGQQSAHQLMLYHLKSVEIRYPPSDCEGLIMFLEFLLEKATRLENIVIKAAKSISREEELVEFRKKLHSLVTRKELCPSVDFVVL